MANHFPSLSAAGLYSVTYALVVNLDLTTNYPSGATKTIWQTPDNLEQPRPPYRFFLMQYVFASAEDGEGNITFDYSWFDQDTIEASIAAQLDSIAEAIASFSGASLADVQAGMTVQRTWGWAQNPVPQSPSALEYTLTLTGDTMTYPAS